MTRIAKLLAVLLFMASFEPLNAFAQPLPKRYEGELDVCGKVSASVKSGKSLDAALLDLFLSYADQPVQFYRSIQQGIVYAAVRSCHYDGTEVVRAALRIDMNLSLLVLSMTEAGVNPPTLRDVLQQAGVDPSLIDEAFEITAVEGHKILPEYTRILPPPFGVTGGLGPASPFIP